MPILLSAVVVGTISRESEPVIIVDKVVGVAVSVPILIILLPLSGEVRGGWVSRNTFLQDFLKLKTTAQKPGTRIQERPAMQF